MFASAAAETQTPQTGDHIYRRTIDAVTTMPLMSSGCARNATGEADRQSRQGEKNGRAKLTIEQVREIRASSASERALAEIYGVNKGTIHGVKSGRTWATASEIEERHDAAVAASVDVEWWRALAKRFGFRLLRIDDPDATWGSPNQKRAIQVDGELARIVSQELESYRRVVEAARKLAWYTGSSSDRRDREYAALQNALAALDTPSSPSLPQPETEAT